MTEITTYKEFTAGEGLKDTVRAGVRKAVIMGRSLSRKIPATTNWLAFPYYHHVFSDEQAGFRRQLKHLKNFGDFVSIDQACELIEVKEPIDGRYFCLSFDDGFRNCYTNMMAITSELDVPVIIYLPTDFIGLDANNTADRAKLAAFYPEDPKHVPFLSWDQCRKMTANKVSFGSHTCSHANLAKIRDEAIATELARSKMVIEEQLNTSCVHFACPWGRQGIDFKENALTIAAELGYRSFATTNRGKEHGTHRPLLIKRDHLLANWENFQLDYFFGA